MGIASQFKRELLTRLSDHIRAHPVLYIGTPKCFIAKLMQAGLKALLQISFTLNCSGTALFYYTATAWPFSWLRGACFPY